MAEIKWYSKGKTTKVENVPDVSDINNIFIIKKYPHNDTFSFNGHRYMAFRKSDGFILRSISSGEPLFDRRIRLYKDSISLNQDDKNDIKNNLICITNNRTPESKDFFSCKYALLVKTFGEDNIEM